MPVPLSLDHPTSVRIATVFGSNYGTIRMEHDGAHREAPVAFGCMTPVEDYQVVVDQAVHALLPPGALVNAINSGTGIGDFNELPVVEIFLGSTAETLSEYLIRQGWAIPDEKSYATSLRSEGYVAALKLARSQHHGVWAEQGVTAQSLGLSPALDHRTAPAVPATQALSHLALAAVILAALVLGMRERFWRAQLTAARREADAEHPPTLSRWFLRGAGFVAKSYVGAAPGLFKPVPRYVATAVAPPADGDDPSSSPIAAQNRSA